MTAKQVLILAALLLGSRYAQAQQSQEKQDKPFQSVTEDVQQQFERTKEELRALQDRITAEKQPLNEELSRLEAELAEVNAEFDEVSGLSDKRVYDLTKLQNRNKELDEEASFVSGQLIDYLNRFGTLLHVAEEQRYEEALEAARLAPENENLSKLEVFQAQTQLLRVSLERLEEAFGGSQFEGSAVAPDGLVKQGTFVLLGPIALFRSDDGETIGTVERRTNATEPTIVPFGTPEDRAAADRLVGTGKGNLPLDTTLGKAHKVEATKETLIEHIRKGGVVMIPIFVMAGLALLVALFKWVVLMFQRRPSKKRLAALLQAVSRRDELLARTEAEAIQGPAGRMLRVGVSHIREPRELIEEVMYENVLSTRLKLQSWLPFIAICAAAAPLLGLLGTVTGIIETFKLITVFGSGDVQQLSGGISKALITTEFGLIIAIPSLMLHAFLSRMAKRIVDDMEKAAMGFANEVSKAYPRPGDHGPISPDSIAPPEAEGQTDLDPDAFPIPAGA